MGLADDSLAAVGVAEGEFVLGLDPVVARIGIPGPLAEACRPAVVVDAATAAAGQLGERVLDMVGYEKQEPAWPAVGRGRLDHPAQVGDADDIVDRVVHQHGVERPPEPHRPHVTLPVSALGVEPPRGGQHVSGNVHQRQAEQALQVHGDVTAAAAEIEDLAGASAGG